MGNTQRRSGPARTAVEAVSYISKLSPELLLSLTAEMRKRAGKSQVKSQQELIRQLDFESSMESSGIDHPDRELLRRIYILMDMTGEELVNYRELGAGLATLLSGDVEHRITCAFELFDVEGAGLTTQDETLRVLSSMNQLCSFFGDKRLVETIFERGEKDSTGTKIRYKEYVDIIARHEDVEEMITRNTN